MSKGYKINIPVTRYESISVKPEDVLEVLKQERRNLVGYEWDGVFLRENGTGYYYKEGYGSHNIGEEKGPDVDTKTLYAYNVLTNAIEYFYNITRQ